MKLIKKILLLWMCLISLLSTDLQAYDRPKINVVTEDLYPFNYCENGDIKGSATLKVKKTLDELDLSDTEINVLPWARAYNIALSEPNVLIYSMLRVDKRENLFKWVAKVGRVKACVIKLKSRDDIAVNKIEDLNNYKMGVYVGSPIVNYLNDYDIDVSNIVGRYSSLVPMLVQGRIDVVPGSVDSFLAEARKQGYEDIFEIIFCIEDLCKDLYCAFSIETDDIIVNQFKEAFHKVNSI